MAVIAGMSIGGVLLPLQQLPAVELSVAFTEQRSTYQLMLLGLTITCLLDLLVAYGVLVVFNTLQPKLAKAAGFSRLVYTLIFGAAISFLFLNTAEPIPSSEAMLANLEAYQTIWSAGLILFGVHILLLGQLLRHAGSGTWLVYLVFLAGGSYSLVHLLKLALPAATWVDQLETVLALPMAVGEMAFAVWLLVKFWKRD